MSFWKRFGSNPELATVNVMMLSLSIVYVIAPTTEMVAFYLNGVGWNTVPAGWNVPQTYLWFFGLFILFIASNVFYLYQLAFCSDYVIVRGEGTVLACSAGHLYTKGDFAYIRTGGIKLLGKQGSHVVMGLKTHVHKLQRVHYFRGHTTWNNELNKTPFELKDTLHALTDGLIFGVKTISLGYFSDKELIQHKKFSDMNLKGFDDKIIEKGDTPSSWMEKLILKDEILHRGYQLKWGDSEGIRSEIRTISEGGEAGVGRQDEGGWGRALKG